MGFAIAALCFLAAAILAIAWELSKDAIERLLKSAAK